jgi:hypothetical protein
MSYPYKKTSLALVLATSMLGTAASTALSAPDSFYTALSKTQQKKFTEAANELEALAVKYQRKRDYTNAYRSQATAAVIRYERDYANRYVKNGSGENRADWAIGGTCWGYGAPTSATKNDNCLFGIQQYRPPTKFKNMGGILVLDKNTVRTSASAFPINELLDVAIIPQMKPKETVVMGCKVTDKSRKEQGIIALVTYGKEEVTNIRQAWYTDFQSRRLKLIDSNLVKCPPIEV